MLTVKRLTIFFLGGGGGAGDMEGCAMGEGGAIGFHLL